MSNFNQAVIWLNEGKKIRCKSWENPKSYIYKESWGQIYSHKRTPAYFMSSHFFAIDWEIYKENNWKTKILKDVGLSISGDKALDLIFKALEKARKLGEKR